MVNKGFEIEEEKKKQELFLDNRLQPEEVVFVIYLLRNPLSRISLTESRPSVTFENHFFSSENGQLKKDGKEMVTGYSKIDEDEFFVVSQETGKTFFFLINEKDHFLIGSEDIASIKTKSDIQVLLHGRGMSFEAKGKDFLYFNNRLIKAREHIKEVKTGDQILTADFLLEKRPNQWKITSFSEDIIFESGSFLRQVSEVEFPEDFPKYRRSPRLHLEPAEDKFKIPMIAEGQKASKNSLLKAILPPVGMILMTGITSMLSGRNPVMMLGMAFMSLMTTTFTVSQYFSEKKERKQEDEMRRENYDYSLIKILADISKKHKEEKNILNFRNPSPEVLSEMIHRYDSRIYERMGNHKDFLEVSLGVGSQASKMKIESDIKSDARDADSLKVKAFEEDYSSQRDVPIPLNLKTQTLGFVGNSKILETAVSNLLLQVAFFHSYRDVNFLSLLPEESYKKTWASWRFLPHFKLQELGLRGLIYDAKTRDIVLSSFYQLLNKRKQILQEAGKETPQFAPHYILTIFEDSYLAGHGINEFLAEDMSGLGVTVIWAKEDQKLLPETVTALVDYKNQKAAELINDQSVYVANKFIPYEALPELESSLRRLSNLEHVEVEKNAIPESLSLLEQYEVKKVEELQIAQRWEAAEPNKSIKSMIGWRGKREYMYWDLHERVHGPHALVGGTTGSGKSEFLTTYLIGLAINFSPEDVGMLIIDWKGGGIANTLAGLPHFMGSITNLDGAGTARALASIKAELDKRMKEFAKYGVNNINAYMSLYKERKDPQPDKLYPEQAIPHLILVSDEFAELKANVPEFLDELTSVARIGRSLGVHLILATQKPSGVVNDQIEANSRTKIALKMASEQDSNELLKTHDAAHITQPGRGYMKVGQNEVYELFQSGYAGVTYDPDAVQKETVDERVYKINELGQTELVFDPGEEVQQGSDKRDLPNQLEAVIEKIQTIFEVSDFSLPAKPWLPNLEDHLVTPEVTADSERQTAIPLGLLDIPTEQAQEVYQYDLKEASHTAIFSSPGYGKSTSLQTIIMNLARQNTPEEIQFYLLDFGTNGLLPLKNLPHVVDITTADNTEKVNKMLTLIQDEMIKRKRLFTQAEVATFDQYNMQQTRKLPIQVVVLDNYDTVAESQRDRDKYDSLISQILREGAALGVYLLITANRVGTIRMSMLSNIQTKIALYMLSQDEVGTLYGRDKLTPQALFGRGQVMIETGVQAIQIFLPTSGDNEAQIYEALDLEIKEMDKDWQGNRPEAIPMVAEEIKSYDFFEEKSVNYALSKNRLPIGYQKANASLFSINLMDEDNFVIIGDEKERIQKMLIRILEAYTHLERAQPLVIFDDLNWLKNLNLPKGAELVKDSIKDFVSEEVKAPVEEKAVENVSKAVEAADDLEAAFLSAFQTPISKENNPISTSLEMNADKLSDKILIVLNPESAFAGITNEKDLRQAIGKVQYTILISDHVWLSKITDTSKYFKSNLRYGLLLKRLSEQSLIPNSMSGREAELLSNEAYAFRGRDIRKVQLTQVELESATEEEF